MATKKFKCKVCGYVHEGDKAPEKCPMCQAPQSEFEEIIEPVLSLRKRVSIPTATFIPFFMQP